MRDGWFTFMVCVLCHVHYISEPVCVFWSESESSAKIRSFEWETLFLVFLHLHLSSPSLNNLVT